MARHPPADQGPAAERTQTVVQFSVGLDNAAGTLSRLCAVLRRARVNIDALSVADNADCGWVRLIATPSARARAALAKAGYTVVAKLVVAVEAENRPGELERLTMRLARAGVNIAYVYGSTRQGETSTLVFGVGDPDVAIEALRGRPRPIALRGRATRRAR